MGSAGVTLQSERRRAEWASRARIWPRLHPGGDACSPAGPPPRRLCSLLELPSPAQAALGPPADRASTSQAPLQGPLRSGCRPRGLPAPSSSEVCRPLGPGSKAMGLGEDLRHPTLPLLLPQPGSPSPGGEAGERGSFHFSFVPTDRQTDRLACGQCRTPSLAGTLTRQGGRFLGPPRLR